jgi:metal-responsive CopG/Arc/MetJ family transcriptional regulator
MRKTKGGKEMQVIKTTINLKPEYKKQLNELVEEKIIASTTDGINQAIELFIKEKKKQQYMEKMGEAAQDKSFIERTMNSQKEFDAIETEEYEEW